MLEASQTTHIIDGKSKVIDFNVDGGEFTEAEQSAMALFLDDPTQDNAENVVVVRDATRNDEVAAMSVKTAEFWDNYLDSMKRDRPNRDDYDLNNPKELQEFTMKEQDYNTKLKYVQVIKEMYSKATGGWADLARTAMNNAAF